MRDLIIVVLVVGLIAALLPDRVEDTPSIHSHTGLPVQSVARAQTVVRNAGIEPVNMCWKDAIHYTMYQASDEISSECLHILKEI